jgi:hypothetical protein
MRPIPHREPSTVSGADGGNKKFGLPPLTREVASNIENSRGNCETTFVNEGETVVRVLLGQPRCVALKIDRIVLVPKLPHPSYRNKRNETITQSLPPKQKDRKREAASPDSNGTPLRLKAKEKLSLSWLQREFRCFGWAACRLLSLITYLQLYASYYRWA